jgi:hypothetical protein
MNLYERIKKIKDFRRAEGRRHSLPTIILLIIMANMSGYFGERPIGDFIEKNKKDLLKKLKPKRKELPSRQTIGRVLRKLDYRKLLEVFSDWIKDEFNSEKKEWFSIDGKAIKGTVTNAKNAKQKYINLVSIFSHKTKQVLDVKQVNNNKESEIPKVRDLIKSLKLEEAIFTIDALHCQKETTKVIKETKNDYVIGLKKNRKKLYAQVKKT